MTNYIPTIGVEVHVELKTNTKIFSKIFIEMLLKNHKHNGIMSVLNVYARGGIAMNSGTACKNLTDGLLIAMAIIALVGLALEFMAFDGEHIMNHPTTSEDITVKGPLDNPYADSYLKLFAAFAIISGSEPNI